MPDWTKTMQQTFEYYIVDTHTWKDKELITTIIDSKIDIDGSAETKGSATFNANIMIGESYIRVYLITIQNGIREKFPLGVYLIQTPSYSFDGSMINVTLEAYTPLIELKENSPDIGYFVPKGTNVMETVYNIINDNTRCPVINTTFDEDIFYDFVSNVNDNWLTLAKDLMATINHSIDLDELGRVIFKPIQKQDSIKPTWVYTDDNSSILYPAISIDNDLYGIPNVIEVVYSSEEEYLYVKVYNDDDNSPISIQNRGREIMHRVTNPELPGSPNMEKLNKYAVDLLKQLSTLDYTITYKHAYCPVKVGDSVILNYKHMGIENVKATVVKQSISCVPGTPVEETAIFSNKLWG